MPADIALENFSAKIFDDCRQTTCPALKLTGRLKNNCAKPAGAQVKITAVDKNGGAVDIVEGWPASTRNIAPGALHAFDLGPLMTYRKGMSKYSTEVIDVRTWR